MKIPAKRILFVSETVPSQGIGSYIIYYRHLKRLEDKGWHVTVAGSVQWLDRAKLPQTWKVIALPNRKWWWPPQRDSVPLSTSIRFYLWEMEYHRQAEYRPDVIVSDMWTKYSVFAAALSKRIKVPLVSLLHDDWIEFFGDADRRTISSYQEKIFAQASVLLPVSQRLLAGINPADRKKARVLRPIPEGSICKHEPEFNSKIVVGYAGKLYDGVVDVLLVVSKLLQKVRGSLVIITDADVNMRIAFNEFTGVRFVNSFDTNAEAIAYLKAECSAILVAYPLRPKCGKQVKSLKASFPSKFCEFSHLCLPVAIFAPRDTEIGDWCIQKEWHGFADNEDEAAMNRVITSLGHRNAWIEMALQSKLVAKTEFNPSNIQREFEDALNSAISRRSLRI